MLCTDAGSPEADAVSWWSLARVILRHGEHLPPTCVEQEAGSEGVNIGVSARCNWSRSPGPVCAGLTRSLSPAMIAVDNASRRGSLSAQSSRQSITEEAVV